MIILQYLDNFNSAVCLPNSTVAMNIRTVSLYLTLYNILHMYIATMLIINALVGNALIVQPTLTPNVFSKQILFTVSS